MRTVTLELLRHGPPHNQLLSPLTPYLALCENHAAVTLQVNFEHNQFLYRLHALDYKLGAEPRTFQLRDTAKELGDLLAKIPGLTAELSRQCDNKGELTHLRLIVSASELALLPFELALAPNGFPGAGQPLLLQSQLPLCLTREVRRVPEGHLQWPQEARVLFISASPPDFGPIPVESHLLALRRAISPWVGYFATSDDKARREEVEKLLVVMPQASIESIEEACAGGTFTHIHVLAHGVERMEGYDVRFGLALHDARDPLGKADVVSGARLATALRGVKRPEPDSLIRPMMVTLASCNSGNVGSTTAGAGASVAHALHEAGIPLVVASQFPLSFPGSVRLVEVLYEGLLSGFDPRIVLQDLRRRLHTQFPENHDWASITAYATLGPDFEDQLASVRVARARLAIDAAMDFADKVTRRFFSTSRSKKGSTSETTYVDETENEGMLNRAQRKIDRAKERLANLRRGVPKQQESQVLGLLASTEKRQAEVKYWTATKISSISQEARAAYSAESLTALRRSRDYYWGAFLASRENSWAVVQYLSLTLVLGHLRNEPDRNTQALETMPERNTAALWSLAHLLSLTDLNSLDVAKVEWAYGNLIELYLLALLLPEGQGRPHAAEAERLALQYTGNLLSVSRPRSFQVYSTRRQLLRYVEWFNTIAELDALTGVAEKILSMIEERIVD
jgi:hypothetical protein